jgi:glyoxalase family protein
VSMSGDSLVFEDPEGLELELRAVQTSDEPLVAEHPEIPSELALQGFDGVRAYTADPERSRRLLEETLGFAPDGGEGLWEIRGDHRGSWYAYDHSSERGLQGAGTVHHVAWADEMDEHEAWQRRVAESEAHPTPIIDRFWFKSIYFREPSGVLFEIATLGPGFATDEDPAHLGEKLVLPPRFEPLRDQIERTVTPIRNPREDWAKAE